MTAHPARWKGHEERAQGRHLLCPRWTGPSGMVYLGTTRGQKPKVITFSDLPDYTGYFTETFSCHCHTSTSKRLIKTSVEKYFFVIHWGKEYAWVWPTCAVQWSLLKPKNIFCSESFDPCFSKSFLFWFIPDETHPRHKNTADECKNDSDTSSTSRCLDSRTEDND